MAAAADLEARQQLCERSALARVHHACGVERETAEALRVGQRKPVQREIAVARHLLPHALRAALLPKQAPAQWILCFMLSTLSSTADEGVLQGQTQQLHVHGAGLMHRRMVHAALCADPQCSAGPHKHEGPATLAPPINACMQARTEVITGDSSNCATADVTRLHASLNHCPVWLHQCQLLHRDFARISHEGDKHVEVMCCYVFSSVHERG